MLKTGEAVERFRASTDLPFQVRGKVFNVSYFGKQNVCVRIHWLPADMNNDQLFDVFSSFGKVIKVGNEKHGDFENGLRRVFMEVFIAEVGHVRQACPPLRSIPGAARVTEAQAQRSANVPVPAPRQVEALGTPVTATPVQTSPVMATRPLQRRPLRRRCQLLGRRIRRTLPERTATWSGWRYGDAVGPVVGRVRGGGTACF